MAPKTQNFSYYQRETDEIVVSVVDESGNPVDLTNTTLVWVWVHNLKSRVSERMTTDNGDISITDAAAGEATITLTAIHTNYGDVTLSHELWVVESSGDQYPVLVGEIKIAKSLARTQ